MKSISSWPKKSLGQNFLVDNEIRDFIIEEVISFVNELRKGNLSILEIGPGKGALTYELLNKLSKKCEFYLVEKDDLLSKKLEEQILIQKKINAHVFNKDFLDFDLGNIKGEYIAVGALPYNVSKKIVEKLLKAENSPSKSIFILQKEVAEDYAARSPKMTFLSAYSNLYAKSKVLKIVSPNSFRPKPKVESAIIEFDKTEPIPDKRKLTKLEKLIRQGFTFPRKTLYNNLKGNINPQFLTKVLKKLFSDEKIRAQNLNVEDWVNLSEELNEVAGSVV